MRIIHLVGNKEWGGGEQYVYDICQHLRDDGRQVLVFTRPIPCISDHYRNLHIPIQTLPLRGFQDIYSALRLSKQLQSGDVLHAHNFKSAFTACLARKFSSVTKIRIILTRHLVRTGKHSLLYTWLYRQLDTMIFVSELARNTFLSTHPDIDTKKIIVLHNSILQPATDRNTPINIRKEFSLPDDLHLLMFHGRITEEKGIRYLVEALSKIQDKTAVLAIIGEDNTPYADNLRTLAKKLGVQQRIVFLGFHKNIFPLLRQADLGIIPSVVQEAYPLSCVEYMSQGKCVIATDNGGQKENITNKKNGLLVPVANTDALVHAINYALEDNRYESMGKVARSDFEKKMTYPIFYNKLLAIYEPKNFRRH